MVDRNIVTLGMDKGQNMGIFWCNYRPRLQILALEREVGSEISR